MKQLVPIYEPHLKWRYQLAVMRQMATGWIGPGATVTRFGRQLEKLFARECVVTGTGTQALLLAYLALNLPAGSTICCPDYGLPACQNAARLLGYKVQLIDVRPDTGCMDVDKLKQYLVVGGPCAAVVFVDHNGYAGDDLLRAARVCALEGIPLVEDSAVALGCRLAGRVGVLSILSFSVPKIITTGQGGAVLTADKALAERLRQLVDQGGGSWRNTRVHTAVGGNFRMTDLQAALGVAQMNDLPSLLHRRSRLWGWYRARIRLANDVCPSGWIATYQAASVGHGSSIIMALHRAGFDCKRLYQPVHRNAPYATDHGDDDFPGAAEVYSRLLYLPSSLRLSHRQVNRICDVIGHCAP